MIDLGKELTNFFSQHKKIRYKKRDIIVRSGGPLPGIYYITKGFVKLSAISRDGQELLLVIFKPGDTFPLAWALQSLENKYYLEAMTSVELWQAPKEEFIAFIKRNPNTSFLLIQRLLIRLYGLLERMEYLVFGNAYQKIASVIFLSVERFGEKEGESMSIPVPFTHKDIASLVGVTRETASIELKKLENKGIIAHTGKIFLVNDVEMLKKESLFT